MKLIKLWQKLAILLVVIILSSTPGQIIAQQPPTKLSIDKGSIESRFDYIIRESTVFEDSKVVKAWWLYRLKTSVSDTLKSLQNEIQGLQNILVTKTSEIDSLKSNFQKTNDKLTNAINEKNSIRFFGFPMGKSAYNSLLWTIIGGLIFFLFMFIILFKRSNVIAVQVKTDLEELKVEFEAFRKRTLEREEKLVRKHYDEMQKYRNNK